MSATSTSTWGLRAAVQLVFFALIVRPFVTLFIGLRVSGREHLPRRGPFVLVANHSSHLDTVSLLGLFPLLQIPHIRPCAAADYFGRNPGVLALSRTFFNILPIERKHLRADDHPVRLMSEAIERGESLLLFPEGTRGAGTELGPLRAGVAHLAQKVPELRVIPVWLDNTGRALPKGEFLPVPFFCEARIGAPLELTGTRDRMLATLRATLEGLHHAPSDPGAAHATSTEAP